MQDHSTPAHAGQFRPKYRIGVAMDGGPYFIDLQIEGADQLTMEQLDADMGLILEGLKSPVRSLQSQICRKSGAHHG